MRALLLAAGLGTRLLPLTRTVPKCLVPIAGQPLLDRWLDLLFRSHEIERVLINTHWLAPAVEAHLAASPWRSRIEVTYEAELLGTGGTILANRGFFGETSFLVAHADNLTTFDLPGFAAAHRSRPSGVALSMLSFRTDDPRSCGILELDDRGIVQEFHEKVSDPPGNLANAAVYLFEPELLDCLAAFRRPVIDLSTEVLPGFLGRILSVETAGYHRDIGTPDSLARAKRDMVEGLWPRGQDVEDDR